MLSGCGNFPSPNVNARSPYLTDHPYLNAAYNHKHALFGKAGPTWDQCKNETGKTLRDCKTREVYRTAGPVPLLAAEVKAGDENMKANQSGIPLATVMGGISLGASASMASAGGVGGMVMGALEILGSGHGSAPQYAGLNRFTNGQNLYAVRYVMNIKDISHYFLSAVHFSSLLSARYGGSQPSWKLSLINIIR
jgi:hypothetical protein